MRRLAVSLIACLLLGTGLVEAQTLFGMVNDFRAARGLPTLTWDGRLAAAANNQANWMAANSNCCDHNQGGKSSALARVTAQGYSAPFVTEIIYLGGSRSHAMTWWQGSPTHLRELTRPSGGQMGAAIAPSRNNKSAFVIVFGWTGGGGSAASGSGGVNTPAQQPAYVVGLDEYGNIQHEVQPGDDLGTIAWRYYGYNWDVIPTIRALNNRTQDEDGLLAPGDILLIPPKAGTYTPAPADESARASPVAAATEPAAQAVAPTPAPEVRPGTRLPGATAPPRPTLASESLIRIGRLPTPRATPAAPTVSPDDALALLELGMLALAVVVQLAVIGGAGLMLWRRLNV